MRVGYYMKRKIFAVFLLVVLTVTIITLENQTTRNDSTYSSTTFNRFDSDSHVRCGAQYFGCFCNKPDAPRFVNEMKFRNPHRTYKECLLTCSNTQSLLAAWVGATCFCGNEFVNKQSVQTSNKCDRKVVNYVEDNCPDHYISAEIYGITEQCQTGKITKHQLSQRFLGNFFKPKDFEQETILSIRDLTTESCFIYCENNEHSLAMMTEDGTCHCGHTTEQFSLKRTFDGGNFTNTGSVAVWKTLEPDYRCMAEKFLPENSSNKIYLRSFPGSGNTWTRHLIECATGIYTGSRYFDSRIQSKGMVGEFDQVSRRRTLVIKFHGMRDPAKTIIIIRNPFDACVANYGRIACNSHTENIELSEFSSDIKWKIEVSRVSREWYGGNEAFINLNHPVLVVYYENLKRDHINELRRILDFIGYKPEDFEERLLCLETESTGQFKRNHKVEMFNPYTLNQTMIINAEIVKLRKFIEKYKNISPLPPYEREL